MAAEKPRVLTVSVASREQTRERTADAMRRIDAGQGYQGEFYSFTTLPLMLKVFSIKRWELITKLQELGPCSLRALARALDRDVKRVHEDVQVLLQEGIVERDKVEKLFVPFAHIRLEA